MANLMGKLLSTMTTHTGVKINKFLENGKIAKKILYPSDSRLVRDYGIFSATIRDAGIQGKHIMIGGKDKCLMLGKTAPTCEFERTIQEQLKEYINAMNLLKYRNGLG